jgi:nitronate monooxygenase
MGKAVLRTKLCDMLDIEYPIMSAGMGPNTLTEQVGAPVDLVVAVSEAGGLGVLGASGYSLAELRDAIHEIRDRTSKPFGVDILLPKNVADLGATEGVDEVPLSSILATLPQPYQDFVAKLKSDLDLPDIEVMVKTDTTTMRPQEAVAICIEEKIPLFCAGLGNPDFMVEEAHANGVKVLAITGNSKNAKRMAAGGIDLLVAQGAEAGGHTGRVGTMALIPACIDAAYPVPVVAAGGIADGRGVAGALAMGCIGVWVGTRFLATDEGGAQDVIKQNIVAATDESTCVSTMFTGKTLRSIRSKFHEAWDESGLTALPFPMQIIVSSSLFGSLCEANAADYIGGFAGQASGIIKEIKPAGEVLQDMVDGAVEILTKKLPGSVTASG